MSNESEIGKEMSEEGKLVGTSDTSQNKVQVEQIAKECSEIININNEPCAQIVTTNITDRKPIQETLLGTEQKLKAIIQGLSIAAFVIDSDHQVLYWNTALEALSNIRAEEIIGTTNHWKAFYPQKRPCMADILIDGGLDDIEKWYAAKYKKSSLLDESFEATDFFPNLGNDGKWLRFTATVIRNTNRDMIGVVETIEDISERKKVENEVKKEKETAQQYLDIVGSMLLVLDATGNISLVNKKGCEILEGTSNEFTGQNWFDHFLLKEDRENVKDVFHSLMRGEIEPPVDYNDNRIISKKGNVKWVRWHNTVIRNKDGAIIGTLSSGEDITERKRVEEDLWIKDRAIASSFNGVAISDLNGKLMYINDAFSRMWGYTVQDALNLNAADLDSDKDEIIRIINDIKEKGFSLGESVAIRKDESLFNIQYSASLITNSLGKPIAMLSNFVDITEYKRAEAALRRSEEQYRLVTENASDAIWTMDLNLKFTYISPSNQKLTGYTTEEALKLPLDELLTPESMELALQTFTAEMQFENSKEKELSRSVTLELNEIRTDGTIVPVEVRMCLLRDTHTNPIGILGITRDITERKKQDAALKKSEEKFVKAFRSSPVAICITRISDGRFLEINKALEKLIGYTRDELLAQTTFGLGIWVDIDERKPLFEELAKTGSVYDREYRFRSKSGDVIFTRYSAEVIDFSGDKSVLSVLTDITEYKKAEELLRKSEEKYRLVVENAMESITISQDGILKFANQSTFDLLDYSQEEVMAKPFIEFIHPDDRKMVLENQIARLNGEKTFAIYPFRIISKQGMIKWIEIQPIVISWGEKPATLNFLRDITEQKKAQEDLKKSEEKFVKAFKSSPIAIYITRISDGKFIEVNESLIQLSGYSRTELLAGSTIGLNLWADSEDRKQVVEQLSKTGSVHDHEYRFRIKNGNEIFVRYSAEMIDFSGEQCVLSVLVDITEQNNMGKSLMESEEKYRSIVENTKDVIMLTNPDGRVSYLSPACFDVIGYNSDDLVGKIPEIFYPEDIEKVHSALSSALQGSSGSNLEYRILTKNGKTRWVSHSWSPILAEDKKLKCIVSIMKNITESKTVELILKAKIEELEKYKNVTVNREIKMVDLKNEINELCKQLNQKPKYPNV